MPFPLNGSRSLFPSSKNSCHLERWEVPCRPSVQAAHCTDEESGAQGGVLVRLVGRVGFRLSSDFQLTCVWLLFLLKSAPTKVSVGAPHCLPPCTLLSSTNTYFIESLPLQRGWSQGILRR